MEEKNWAVSRELDGNAPTEGGAMVKEELKGLWVLDGVYYVVEGECPVSAAGSLPFTGRKRLTKTTDD